MRYVSSHSHFFDEVPNPQPESLLLCWDQWFLSSHPGGPRHCISGGGAFENSGLVLLESSESRQLVQVIPQPTLQDLP